jgi:hypothetical protein
MSEEKDLEGQEQVEEQVVDQVTEGGDSQIPSVDEATDLEETTNIEYILNLAESNPAIKELPQYQNLLKTVDKVRQEGSKAKEKVKEEEVEEEVVDQTTTEEVQDEDDSDNIFGLGAKKKKGKELQFDEDSDVVKYMNEKYSIGDPEKFFNSVDKWRNQSQKATEFESQYNDMLEGLGSLPQPIKDAIDAYANAQDYHQAFNSSTSQINFESNAEDIGKEEMVSHYFKAKVEKKKAQLDEGEIYEEEYNDYIDDLHDNALRLFKSEKRDWERERADIIKREEDRSKSIKNSAASSVDSLKEKYPNFSSNELKKIRTRLVQQDLRGLFFDKDGNYKADAAEKLALALYGNKLIDQLTAEAKADGESSANADIVARGKKKIVASKSKGGTTRTDSNNAVQHLTGQFVKDPYS